MSNKFPLKPMPIWKSVILFGIPTIAFLFVTRFWIPYMKQITQLHPALIWFIYGGLFIFIPLFALAVILFRIDGYGYNDFIKRFRLEKLNKEDWLWTLGSILIIFALTGVIMFASRLLSIYFGIRALSTSAPFVHFDPLKGRDMLIFFAWLPFFFFNIFGEELLWRGYILPRQELSHGNFAWLVNSSLWLLFHVCFGIDLMVILLPILFVLPYIVSKRKKTWVGIIIHAVVNGPTFVMVALGFIK